MMPSFKVCIAAVLLVNIQGQLILGGGRGKVKLELYNADRTTLIGPMVDDMVIDLAKTPKLNIKGSGKSSFQTRRFSSMSFYIDDKPVRTDSSVPSWMLGDPDSAWTPTVGIHTIKAIGYRRNEGKGTKMLESSVRVKVIDTSTKTPTKAPVKAPVASPVAAPVAAPVMTPAVAPVVAPVTLPIAAPVAVSPVVSPFVAPVASPVLAPTKLPIVKTTAPTKGPTTKAPTRHPTSAPTAAPTLCVNDIVKYINSITLSNRTLSVNGFTQLDQALVVLLLSNTRAGVQLSTCNVADQKRIRQRYAYFATVYSSGIAKNDDFDYDSECDWSGLTCNEHGTVTKLELGNKQMGSSFGSIPADVGLLANLTKLDLYNTGVTGSLPSSMALLTRLTYVDIGGNKLNGTVPTFLGAWTDLEYFDLFENEFTGRFPFSIAASWTRLGSFYINSNKFTGQLPPSIGHWWVNMTYFDVKLNDFTGPLPTSIGVWTQLLYFRSEFNQLSGVVPRDLSNWTSVRSATFHGNSFNGSIPVIGNKFCPRNDTSNTLLLYADCLTEIVCVCCNYCCDTTGRNCTKNV
jgi:Leucine-rich repeat (LRR) protein